jgi:predicted HTH domain antitoxin
MSQIIVDVPEESLLALKIPHEKIGDELRMAAAFKLYEIGKLSSGAAAQLAGMPRVVFLSKLADYGVESFRIKEDDLARETPIA